MALYVNGPTRFGVFADGPDDNTQGLILRVPLNGDQGDVSGYSNQSTTSPARYVWLEGRQGAFVLSANPLTWADSTLFRPTNVTIMGWISASTWSGVVTPVLTKNYTTGSLCSWEIRVESNGTVFTYEATVGGTLKFGQPSFTFATNKWYHLALTFDGTTLRGFINGSNVQSTAASGALSYDAGSVFSGKDIFGNAGNMNVSDLRIYNRALVAGEVQAIYAQGLQSISSDIDVPRLLGSTSSTETLSFALSDATDTASFSVTTADRFSFALSDAVDTAAFVLADGQAFTFAVNDATDTASFNLTDGQNLHFAVSDATDIAAFTLVDTQESLHFALSDAVDTASFRIANAIAPPVVNPYPFGFTQGFPQDLIFVDEGRVLMPAWHYFLLALWNKTGSSNVSVPNSFYVGIGTNSAGQQVPFVYNVSGQAIGQVATTTPRGPPQVLSIGAGFPGSYVWHAPVTGFLTVPGGKVEYSRDGTHYYEINLVGGQLWVLDGDYVRISWFNAAGPPAPVVWWPGGGVQ